MCGISGAIWNSRGRPVDQGVLDRMTDVLGHRGPDGRGTHIENHEDGRGVALGHRRLAIIDLAGGKQPLSNEDQSVWLTFNGEIYNYRELRKELEAGGHRFRTDSDSECIVHLYEESGIDCLARMRGMFALAVWDRRRRRLFLARDRMGQKPLVYRQENGRLLFASEIKSLLQVPGVPRKVDRRAIDAFLALLYVPHPGTMFEGIKKLPPAHYAVYEDGQLTIRRYWTADLNLETSRGGKELQERLAHELDESVRLRLRSDVPLGAFLSGGIDSTTIVGLMQHHSRQPTKTYTIGFPVSGYDETKFAKTAADFLKTDHHEFQVNPDSIGILPKLVWHFDEPFGDSSAIPTYYVSEVTRRHVKVALTGDGGDELFGGYPRYQTVHRLGAFDRLPGAIKGVVACSLWKYFPAYNRESCLARRLRFRMQLLQQPANRRYATWVSIFQHRQRRALYSDEFSAELNGRGGSGPIDFIAEAMDRAGGRSPGRRAMLADMQTYLPCDLLAKVDITSMAHGLECRCPMLDHRVVELAVSVGYRQLTEGLSPKPLLGATFSELIPPELANREKMGFRIPLDDWFRDGLEPFAREVLLGENNGRAENRRGLAARGYFRRGSLENLLEEHKSARWNHGDRIWALLCLELWHRTFIDPPQPPQGPCDDSVLPQGMTLPSLSRT